MTNLELIGLVSELIKQEYLASNEAMLMVNVWYRQIDKDRNMRVDDLFAKIAKGEVSSPNEIRAAKVLAQQEAANGNN